LALQKFEILEFSLANYYSRGANDAICTINRGEKCEFASKKNHNSLITIGKVKNEGAYVTDHKFSFPKVKPNLKKTKPLVSRSGSEAPIPFPKEGLHRRDLNESEGEDRRPSRVKR
jgi:hypothetical protein